MPEYVFVDGPLIHQTTTLAQLPAGITVVVEVMDLYEDPLALPRYQYVIEDEASCVASGRLRFAADVSAGHLGAAAERTGQQIMADRRPRDLRRLLRRVRRPGLRLAAR